MDQPVSSSAETTIDILLTTTAFGGGGTERYVEDLALELAARNVRVAVSVDSGSLDRARRLRGTDVPVHVVGARSSDDYTDVFRSLIDRLRPRIIHFSGWAHHREITQVALSCRIPTLYTNHCTPRVPLLRERLGINTIPFALYRQRGMAKQAGAVISISQLGLKNLGIRIGRDVPSVVVYYGVPYVETTETSRDVGAPPRIVWLGSLIKRKRPLLAIEVFRRILKAHPAAQLEIFGDGPLLAETRRAADRLPPGSVQVRGFRTPVVDSLRGAYAYLQTSANEGLAYSVLDAMSAGLPVIATDAGATSEGVLHGKTGLVCRIDDADSLGEALGLLLDSPETAAAYGRESLSRVRNVFGLDRMVTETLAAYSTLCSVRISPKKESLNGFRA
jgi:glycosyltransferase involved in cell wall biosynthesis